MKISERAERLAPSSTLEVKAEADRLRARGLEVIDFGLGEPDYDTPVAIRDAAKVALDRGDTRYGSTSGKPSLRRALAARAAERFGGTWSESEVVVGVGGKGVLFLLMQALVDAGDEILIFSPYWVSFPDQIRLAAGVPVAVPAREEDGFVPDPRTAEERLTPRCRGLILNSPCNPTGAVIPPARLEAFADLARRRDLFLISDETYERFVYPGHRFASAAGLRERSGDRVVVVHSFSKTFAMTGWRVGSALAPGPVAAAMARIQSHDATHPASFAQAGAEAALAMDDGVVAAMVADYTHRRQVMLDGLASVPGVTCVPPGGAFYVFPAVGELCRRAGCGSSRELAARLLREAGLAVVPGEAFGVEGHLRLSYALPDERLREGLARLRRFAASG